MPTSLALLDGPRGRQVDIVDPRDDDDDERDDQQSPYHRRISRPTDLVFEIRIQVRPGKGLQKELSSLPETLAP